MPDPKHRPWGKINRRQPYDVVTRDLMRAFFHARMNHLERAIFQYVLEHTWGEATRGKRRDEPWPESAPCEVNVYALAATWKYDRRNLNSARKALADDGILVDVEGRYRVNKDVDSWPGHRFAGDALDYAASAIRAGTTRPTGPVTENRSESDHGYPEHVSTDRSESHYGYRLPMKDHCGYPEHVGRVLDTPKAAPDVYPVHVERVSDTRPHSRNGRASEEFNSDSNTDSTQIRGRVGPEPFIPPTSEADRNPDPPGLPPASTDADRAAAWAYDRVLAFSPGDVSLAEVASIQAGSWVRDEGYGLAEVQTALIRAIGKCRHPAGVVGLAHSMLSRNPAPASSPAGRPVRPSEINRPAYHVPLERPKPPGQETPRP